MIEIIERLTDEIYRMELFAARLHRTGYYRRAKYRSWEAGRLREILDIARHKRSGKTT